MKFTLTCPAFALLFMVKAFSQTPDTLDKISLPVITIKAFEQNRKLKDVPAAVNYIGRQTFDNFSSASIVSALNTTPGVRIEERSPASYRVNIRGSSLRSPFGVRNVKIYYNDIPFTDPGGQSYLNQLGNYNINSIEIIKGANNSIYGAGTGGVILIESLDEKEKEGVFGEYALGSFGLQNYAALVTTSSDKAIVRYGFQHQKSEGYREQSKVEKSIANWNALFKMGRKSLLKTSFLFGDLYYQTPGALTEAEFKANPTAARPGTGAAPGAVAANAHIRQKTFLSGASYEQPVTQNVQNKTTLYGMFTEFRNPNLRGYEKTSEPHFGARTFFSFRHSLKEMLLNIEAGGEFQQGFTTVNVHKNVNGYPDSLISYDNINNQRTILFVQAALDYNAWSLVSGASWNTARLRFQRFVPSSLGPQARSFGDEVAPRFSLMRKFKKINIYTSIAKGFSPPATDELLPTGGAINLGLEAEEGTNYDFGVKGSVGNNIYVDINAFTFSLRNTIVQRRDAAGGNSFINAGSTKQHGIETLVSYPALFSSPKIKNSLFWVSHTWHNFHYKEFAQLTNDYSGKRLPSVPQNTLSSGISIVMQSGLSGGVNYYFSDKLPLNDANSAYAKAYHLIGAKLGWQKRLNRVTLIRFSAGVDNLLNQHYSLGNDINAFGGRYYNPAPGRNFFTSVSLGFKEKV